MMKMTELMKNWKTVCFSLIETISKVGGGGGRRGCHEQGTSFSCVPMVKRIANIAMVRVEQALKEVWGQFSFREKLGHFLR